jgi:Yip1 domain
MNLIERVKNILTTPKTEWTTINGETETPMSLLTKYIVPLAIIPAAATILGSLIFGAFGVKFGLISAIVGYIGNIITYFVGTYAIDGLATNFGSEKDLGKSAQTIGYAMTAGLVGSALGFIPVLGWLIAIAGWVYGIYIMYLGIPITKKTPQDKIVVYMIVVYLIMFVVNFIISSVIAGVIWRSMFAPSILDIRL